MGLAGGKVVPGWGGNGPMCKVLVSVGRMEERVFSNGSREVGLTLLGLVEEVSVW